MGTESSYHHGALRQALLRAAMATVEEGGDLSLRGVARRAGVSHAAPYHHFADRRALVAAVAEEGLERLGHRLATAAEQWGGDDPLGRLVEVGVAYVRFAMENRALFRLVFSAELSDRSAVPGLEAAYADAWSGLTRAMNGVVGPSATEEEVRFWSLRGWSMVHGLANLLLDGQVPGVHTVEDAERVARRMLQTGAPHGVRW